MKLYQDSGFKWTVASTLVLASIIGMTTFAANAAPPLANPPGGNISPKFTTLETATDVIVGQNVQVGGDIRSTTGGSFALKAPKVNFTNDIEVAGGGIINKVLQVIGSIKGKDGNPLLLDSDAIVSGNLNIKGGLGGGITIDANNITQKTGGVIHIGPGMLDVTGKLNAPMGASLGTTDVVSLNATTFMQATTVNAGKINSGNISAPTGVITGASFVSNGNIDTAAGTITGANIVSKGNISLSGTINSGAKELRTSGDMWSNGSVLANNLTIAKIDKNGLSGNYGGLSYDDVGKSIRLNTNKPTSDHVSIEGIDFYSTATPYSATIKYTAPGSPPLKIDAPLAATGYMDLAGHLKAGSIGSFTPRTYKDNTGGNKVTVTPGKVGAASTLSCKAAEVMMSCSLFSAKPTLTSSVDMEIVYILGKPIWKCSVNAFNAGAADADYYASAVCFNPNG